MLRYAGEAIAAGEPRQEKGRTPRGRMPKSAPTKRTRTTPPTQARARGRPKKSQQTEKEESKSPESGPSGQEWTEAEEMPLSSAVKKLKEEREADLKRKREENSQSEEKMDEEEKGGQEEDEVASDDDDDGRDFERLGL